MTDLMRVDPEVADALNKELHRQQNNIELIASENFVSEEVLATQGSVLTNKYAEGYPGKRYYGGCEYVDIVETLAIERAKALFGAEGANVQPHSGTSGAERLPPPHRRAPWHVLSPAFRRCQHTHNRHSSVCPDIPPRTYLSGLNPVLPRLLRTQSSQMR